MQSDALMKNNILKKTIALFMCLCLFCLAGCGDTAKSQLVSDADLATSSCSLGDYVGDYTVTDVNGNTYTFSELLETKKAIVLNFWFINCGPCGMEFPYLQTAFDAYSNDIALLAISPIDEADDIKEYAAQKELTIPMASGETAWATSFGLQGFPTTVVIDRYGSIAFMHMGAVTEDGVFEKIFEYFTADNYKQTTIKNISDIE